jgi:hypothetical protein
MKHQNLSMMLPILLLLVFPPVKLPAADQAEQIMRNYYSQPDPDSIEAEMVMVLKDKAGRISKKVLALFSRFEAGGTSNYTEVLAPADVRGTRFLSFTAENGAEEQRLWLPELGRIRKISTSSEGDRFLGSDLFYWDMKNHRYEDFSYKLVGEGSSKCTRNGKKETIACWVIESYPKARSAPYGKIVMNIGKDDYFAYRSDMWTPNGSPVKTIMVAEIVQEQGVSFPTQTFVAAEDGHKTLLKVEKLELNAAVPERVFSLQYLSR